MVKSSRWDGMILKVLKNTSLNYEELFKVSKLELKSELELMGKELGRRSERGFNKALLSLLYKGCVIVSGYDFNVHRHVEGVKKGESMGIKNIQTIKKEGLMFDLFRTDQTYVLALLNELESVDSTRKAREKLQRLFEIKYRQYAIGEELYWNDLYKDLGVEKPGKRSLGEIRDLFNGILFYISSNSANREFLKNAFSWALSNEEDSIIWFERFILNIKTMSELKEELVNILVNSRI